jgi:hypothetical protein
MVSAATTVALAASLLSAPCSDRSVKLTLIEQSPRSPQILILGSSRARQAEASFLEQLTGKTGFNAAVTGGTAADAWVMTRFTADRFPGGRRRFIWFVDAGVATDIVNPDLRRDPRARRYLSATCRERSRYLPDGSLAGSAPELRPEHSGSLRRALAKAIAGIRSNPPRGGGGENDPKRYRYFEQAIQYMNDHGTRPVIVLNPIHPVVFAELRKYGFPARAIALAYLTRLHDQLDFVVVDGQDSRRWGGSTTDWSNPTHISRDNMRRLLRYVVAHSAGALR